MTEETAQITMVIIISGGIPAIYVLLWAIFQYVKHSLKGRRV